MRWSKLRTAAVALAALLSFPCAAGDDRALLRANARARQFVQQTLEQQRIPGLQVAVVRNGRVVLSESYGWANVENRVPVTAQTRFPINSATKAFTGVALMQLVEAGQVELDAPVSRYLSDLPEAWRGIRVRQLLAHTSGLPDIVDANGAMIRSGEADAWQAVKALPATAGPGDRFAYNQTNYGLLAQIVAKVTGHSYERYLSDHQFSAVGMPRTSFGDSYELIAGAATVYAYTPRQPLSNGETTRLSHWAYEIPYSLWAGGGIQTTADELARWLIALSEGRLIGAPALRAMWTPERLNDGSAGEWGLGWPVLQAAPQRQVAGIGGARAAFVVYPDQDLAVIVLTNLAGAQPQRFVPKIAEFYLAPAR
ncbi:serine hydrolase domain-containing protein [Lysobacter silvisoli]|uniref:Class A beta-lactamase-related serine hydrolase n=1 Tax=Lysobacter silvisoli TaxID=2293254 RepID=A0A371JY07_9GAMM|nr:serine hydrolase domain-containing protein [Lysobacter silvisoli]RDZ26549.1 class A beta-lactamase-related serine hydrolase [Lysobacter silvisoli]